MHRCCFAILVQHGTWPWRGDRDRLSIFMKYTPAAAPSIGRHYLPDEYIGVNEEAQQLLLPPTYSEGQSQWVDPAPVEVAMLRDEERERQKRRVAARL